MADASLAACLAEIKTSPGKFYVYVLSRPDGSPFYVGCAEARAGRHQHRILDHEQMASRGTKSLKCSVIRKIVAVGGEVKYAIESWHDTVDEVFAREIVLIAAIGRRDLDIGPLVNGNDGGTGNLNTRQSSTKRSTVGWTAEKRAIASERLRKRLKDNPSILKNAHAKLRDVLADPVRRKIILRRISETARNPEVIAKRVLAFKATTQTPEYRRLLSDRAKKNWSDQDIRSRILSTRAKTQATPEYRKRRVEIATEIMARPGARDNTAEKQKAVWADPEYRRHHSERLAKLSRDRSPEVEARRVASIRKFHAEKKLRKAADELSGSL